MTDLRTAAQQALEALDEAATFHRNLPDQHARRLAAMTTLRAALAEPVPPIGKASTDVGVPVYVLKKAEPVQEPQEHLLQQALEALLMMRDRYSDDNCPACAHADAAIKLLRSKQ